MNRHCLALSTLGIAAAACAQPKVFWASDPVLPHETVLVFGDGFGDSPQIEIARLADNAAHSPTDRIAWPKRSAAVIAVQPDDKSVKFVVPRDFAPGAYALRISGPKGRTAPVRLNCPTLYWCQGDAGTSASPGGWMRVFGRCLQGDDRRATVVLKPAQRESAPQVSLVPKEATPWSLAVRLPDQVSEGRYRVFVHNGFGGASGWSEGPEITVAKPAPWPRESFDVKDFGASGEGMAHDGAAIRAALKQAERNGGGIVYLPRGRYRITGTLEIPRYTVLRGEGTQLVCLFWPDADEPYTLIRGTDHFGIQDLTVYCSNYRHCVEAAVGRPDSGNTFLRRVRVRADIYRGHQKPEQIHQRFTASLRLSTGGGDVVRFGGENVEITDCDLYGSGRSLYLLRVRGARISGNTFYNGRWGWYCFDGSDGLIFENNRIIGADLMSTGGSLNCYTSAYSQNVYYAHNRLSLAHGWDREAMTTDAGGGAYYGTAAEIGPDKLVLAGEPDWKGKQDWTGAGVFVLGGRGMGQYRRIAKYDGRVVTLDRPWDVPPDEESLISITMLQRNYLFIGNEFHDVGIALQYYGTSVDHVAFGNKCTRGGGFYNSGRWYHHFQPSWYCQFIENEILEGNCYRFGPNNATDAGPSFLGTFGMQSHDGTAPLALCSLHRRNRLRNNAEIRLIGVDRDNPGLRDVVVEHNVIENAARGIYVDSGCLGVLVRENRFENVERERVSQRQLREEMNKKRAALIGQQDPVAYFSFDNPSDSMVRDVSGHGFWAMGTTRIEFGRGISGKAPRFDGSAYFVVGDDGMLQFPKITVSAWIKPDLVQGRWGVVAKRSRSAPAPYVLAIRDGRVTFEGTDAAGNWSYNFSSGPVLKPNVWSHIAAVCEEGAGVRLYSNGELVAEKRVTEPLAETTDVLTIGYENWGGIPAKAGQSGNFHGFIDEVKIWSRLLSPDEIAAEYAALKPAAEADARRMAQEAAARSALARKYESNLVADGGVKWRLVEFDDFERDTIGSDWKTLRGRWVINNGRVSCSETAFLGYARKVGFPVRIEFDGRSDRPGDLTAFWGTEAQAYKGGYFIGFASNNNTANKILRLGEQVAINDGPVATPGRWHHVIAQAFDGKVQLIVDGRLVLEYADPDPLTTAYMPGIIAWSEGEFDNVRIYTGR